MPIPPVTDLKSFDTRHALAMVLRALLGPIVFLGMLTLVYTWESGYCLHASRAGELATLLGAALIIAGAGATCLREYRSVRRVTSDDAPNARARLVSFVGLYLNAFSLLLLIGLSVPILFLRPCD